MFVNRLRSEGRSTKTIKAYKSIGSVNVVDVAGDLLQFADTDFLSVIDRLSDTVEDRAGNVTPAAGVDKAALTSGQRAHCNNYYHFYLACVLLVK